MKEFVEKLIERLEEYKYSHLIERDSEMLEHCKEKEMDCEGSDCFLCVWDKATEIVNQLAEEYNNGCCEWEKVFDDDIDSEYKPSCSEDGYIEITGYFDYEYCPCCGKKIKVVE